MERKAKEKLPLPSVIASLSGISDKEKRESEKPDEQHTIDNEGKVRSFAHVRGQWALHVFCDLNSDIFAEFDEIVSKYANVRTLNDVHLSLIRGYYTTRYHQINCLSEMLAKTLSNVPPFDVCLNSIQTLENEDKTRIFVCICDTYTFANSMNKKSLNLAMRYIQSAIDEFASKMNPHDYDGNSFLLHSSFAWTLPQFKNEAIALANELNNFLEEPLVIEVNRVNVKCGNRVHTIKLKI